jgi:hypothetical protein
MSPAEIGASGTHTYAGAPAEMFAATAAALQTLGNQLTMTNEAKGSSRPIAS